MNMPMTERKINRGEAPRFNRRYLLATALPAALAATYLSGAGAAGAEPAETQILKLFRQHRAIMDAAAAYSTDLTGEAEDEEKNRLFYKHAYQIEDEMMALPCTCAADFAAKVIVDTVKGGLFSDWETGALWIEARALVGEAA